MITDASLIEDILHLRLPEADIRRHLLNLTPAQATPHVLHQWITAIRKTAVPLPPITQPVLDCCGTGGSGLPHYNTSTTVAFVLAAGGVPVVKFGNRAIQSQSGSFDLLEQLGIPAQAPLERLPEMLEHCKLVFLYAPQCYPALAPFNALRRSLQTRTLFNFLGPLLNPVQPAYRTLGISSGHMQTVMAQYLAEYEPPRRAWLLHAPPADNHDTGLDEIAVQGTTHCLDIQQRQIVTDTLTFAHATESLHGPHDPQHNRAIFDALIQGEDTHSIYHRMVCLNAGAGFVVAGQTDSLETGAEMAADLLAGGKVRETVVQCRRRYESLCR